MKEAEWEQVLLAATEKVWLKVGPLAERGRRGRVVGVGAAGDQTIFADKLAEDIILTALSKRGPLRLLSEEAGSLGDEGARTIAVVDPLDGSSNFEHGIPFYCTSVAIAAGDSAEDVEVGVVRDLVNGDVYTARKGRGARKNGKPIGTSRMTDPAKAVVGVDLSRGPPGLAAALAGLMEGVKRQVHFGANALELCYLAEGKTDSFVDLRGRMRITDFAAAALIAREAGAVVTGPGGRGLSLPFDLKHRFSFVASANPTMHRKVLELCRGAFT
ncbi:MAG: fructose-1,6-bisphosphatase [Nitrososphaerota archaeon]|nr:fructose-1,6-bisphosphatase [Nitrososphaerota archaeon]